MDKLTVQTWCTGIPQHRSSGRKHGCIHRVLQSCRAAKNFAIDKAEYVGSTGLLNTAREQVKLQRHRRTALDGVPNCGCDTHVDRLIEATQRPRANREVRPRVRYVVVPQHFCRRQRRGDVIRTARERLAWRPRVSSRHVVSRQEVTTPRRQRTRINSPEDLAIVIGRPGRIAFVDGEGRTIVSNVVVSKQACRSQRCADVISPEIAPGRATIGRRDAVARPRSKRDRQTIGSQCDRLVVR